MTPNPGFPPTPHQWVAHVVLPVTPMQDPLDDEGFTAIHDEELLKKSILTAPMGCLICDTPLNTETVHTDCPGRAGS